MYKAAIRFSDFIQYLRPSVFFVIEIERAEKAERTERGDIDSLKRREKKKEKKNKRNNRERRLNFNPNPTQTF